MSLSKEEKEIRRGIFFFRSEEVSLVSYTLIIV